MSHAPASITRTTFLDGRAFVRRPAPGPDLASPDAPTAVTRPEGVLATVTVEDSPARVVAAVGAILRARGFVRRAAAVGLEIYEADDPGGTFDPVRSAVPRLEVHYASTPAATAVRLVGPVNRIRRRTRLGAAAMAIAVGGFVAGVAALQPGLGTLHLSALLVMATINLAFGAARLATVIQSPAAILLRELRELASGGKV